MQQITYFKVSFIYRQTTNAFHFRKKRIFVKVKK